MTTAIKTRPTTTRVVGVRPAIGLLVARVLAVALSCVLGWWLVAAAGFASSFPPTPLIACLVLLPVNIGTLLAARRMSGASLPELLGFDRGRLGRDIAWGLLWLCVLYLPFTLALMGAVFALHGAAAFERFETIFVPSEYPQFPVAVSVVLGALAVLTFAPLNAPAEELAFRGLAQPRLRAAGKPVLAIVLPSLIFGLQHVFFAPTLDGMVAYGVAFFVWGLVSALIYARQGRLMPLVVAHFLVNFLMTLPAVILPLVIPEMSL